MSEHEAFSKLIDALSRAESAARELSTLRYDQKIGWEQIAELMLQMREKCYRFAERGLN